MTQPTELEKESLEAHVDLCALRYEQMDKRLEQMDEKFKKIDTRFDSLDSKIDKLEHDHKRGNTQIMVALIGATATIIGSFIAVIVSLL
jgi:uncharacterized protein YdcH (DUF465 family)